MEETRIDHPSTSQVNMCANSKEGQKFLHNIGMETKALNPTLYFVPWITFNGVGKKKRYAKNMFDNNFKITIYSV